MCILSRSPMMCGYVIASPRGLLFCPQFLWWFCILWNWRLHPSWTALLHLLLWNNVLLCFPVPWLIPLCLPFWLLFKHWDVQVSVLGTWSSYVYLFFSYVDDFQNVLLWYLYLWYFKMGFLLQLQTQHVQKWTHNIHLRSLSWFLPRTEDELSKSYFSLTCVTTKWLKQIHILLEFLIQFYFYLDTFLQLKFLEEFSLEKSVPAWFWPIILIKFLFCSETWKRSLFLVKVSLTWA